jgi:hypothetical protein
VVVVDVVVVVVDVVVAASGEVAESSVRPDEQDDATSSAATMAALRLRHDRRLVARMFPPGSPPAHATLRPVAEKITLVLPVDAEPPPDRPLAAGFESLRDRALGFVDNGLWLSMVAVIDAFSARALGAGARVAGVRPFDHLAPDFAHQRAALAPFAETLDGAVVGLGN